MSRVSAEEAEEYPQLNVINVKSCGPHCSHFIELFYIECYLIRTVLEIFVLDFKGQIHYCLAPNCSTAKRPLGACCARAVERRI